MKYHFRQGSDRRMRKRRFHLAAASSLLMIGVCSTTLYARANRAEGLEDKSAAHKTSSAQTVAVMAETTKTPAKPTTEVRVSDCGGGGSKRPGLADSSVPQLRKLAEYEFVCGGEV